MASLLEKKNGGPYSKKDQEKRRMQVHTLHFEKGYSAVRIAQELGANRNTINEDIKYWYSNIKEEVKQGNDDYILRQIGRLETQRSRIVEKITENKEADDDGAIKYEKMLLEMDVKINNLLLRINSSSSQTEVKDIRIQEGKIKDMVLFLLIKYSRDSCLKKEEVISEIINLQQCTDDQAYEVFQELEKIGLECCKKFTVSQFVYDLMEFAFLRRYLLPNDSFVVKINSLFILDMHHKGKLRDIDKRFSEKYGTKERWEDQVFAEHEKEKASIIEKYAETRGNIIGEALESISDLKLIKKYMRYINVFFGDKRSLREKMMDER